MTRRRVHLIEHVIELVLMLPLCDGHFDLCAIVCRGRRCPHGASIEVSRRVPSRGSRVVPHLGPTADVGSLKIARHLGRTFVAWIKELEQRDAPGVLNADERAELKRLHKENAELKQDREILKTGGTVFRSRDDQVSRCWVVDDHRHLFEVQRLCELVELPLDALCLGDPDDLGHLPG